VTEANLSCTLVHVDLTVADMERSVAFYTKSLGLLVLEDCAVETEAARFLSAGTCPKMRMVFLTSGNRNSMLVELIQLLDDGGHGASAASARRRDVILAFLVSDLAEATRAMAADGQHPVSDVIEIELTQLGRAQVVFYRDPDGYLIEFVAFVEAG
jgi:catechol 2,3-dioxygenase-like lactoylglutathione lyase family enzyme